MNLNNVTFYIVAIVLILELFNFDKIKSNTLFIISVYIIIFYIIYKYTYSFTQISTYYQIVNYLNTKNNLLVLITILYIYSLNKNPLRFNIIIILALFIFLYNYNLMQVNKEFYGFYNDTNNNLNINLLNGIMLIHPLMLYTYYGLYIYYITNYYQYIKNVNVLTKKTDIYIMVVMILASILLGCWWAEQELSWGGWWSWDLVELIALNFLLLSLVAAHSSVKNVNKLFSKSLVIYIFMFLSSLLFVRFNLINSIHNFLNSESQNQFLFYINYIYALCIITISLSLRYLNKYNYNKIYYINKIVMYLVVLFILMYVIIILILLFNISYNLRFIYNNIILAILLYIYNNTYIKKIHFFFTFTTFIIILFKKNIIYIDILAIILVLALYTIFQKFENKISRKIHLLLVISFFLSLYQIYLFNFTGFANETNHLILTKISFVYNNIYIHLYHQCYTFYTNIKLDINLLMDIKRNTLFGNELFKSIFEKKVYMNNSNLMELYNYNIQQLNQPINHIIFLTLIALLYYSLTYIRSKSTIIYI